MSDSYYPRHAEPPKPKPALPMAECPHCHWHILVWNGQAKVLFCAACKSEIPCSGN